jgi:hypothetical protein
MVMNMYERKEAEELLNAVAKEFKKIINEAK